MELYSIFSVLYLHEIERVLVPVGAVLFAFFYIWLLLDNPSIVSLNLMPCKILLYSLNRYLVDVPKM